MAQFKGKAIYNPSGKAGEYSRWACNFYTGCSNGCEYCYLKKGIGKAVLGSSTPTLKKCFRDESHALDIFEREMLQNLDALQEDGIFFSFTTDPLLEKTIKLTSGAVYMCLLSDIPVKVLTKRGDWVNGYKSGNTVIYFPNEIPEEKRNMIAFGFTLTGHDELEPHASPNAERIAAMRKLHNAGFKTFASVEPIVDLASSEAMIEATLGYCDLYKIGLMTGGSKPDKDDLFHFVGRITKHAEEHGAKVYWKESVRRFLGREIICAAGVDSDYNLFRESLK